ncbi:enoyl-CoA hydratase/isomerase family protein [Achromobacter aloeverae]
MHTEKSKTVVLGKEDGLATITLSRPEKRNALSNDMRLQFGECIEDVASDAAIKVVLVRGEGAAFCAGADLEKAPDSALEWRDRILLAQKHHIAIARMQKPVIAAVQGPAVGGGASIALAADILVMAEDARLVFPFVRLGVVPDGGLSYLLQAKLGAALSLDLLLTGGTLGAAEARGLGLTRRVVPRHELEAASEALARELLQLPWEALMLTKSLCAQHWAAGLERVLSHEADAFALASSTEGHARALAAVRETLRKKEEK